RGRVGRRCRRHHRCGVTCHALVEGPAQAALGAEDDGYRQPGCCWRDVGQLGVKQEKRPGSTVEGQGRGVEGAHRAAVLVHAHRGEGLHGLHYRAEALGGCQAPADDGPRGHEPLSERSAVARSVITRSRTARAASSSVVLSDSPRLSPRVKRPTISGWALDTSRLTPFSAWTTRAAGSSSKSPSSNASSATSCSSTATSSRSSCLSTSLTLAPRASVPAVLASSSAPSLAKLSSSSNCA